MLFRSVDSRAATHLAMPISPAYQWSETALTVTVRAECRGATSGATDVYSSPYYISANAAPFFLELDLHGAIDSTRSVANVARDVVTLKLFKAAEGLWGRLLIDMPRAERLKRREKSRALAAEEAQATTERKKRAAWDDSRFSLGHQMDKDRARRATLGKIEEEWGTLMFFMSTNMRREDRGGVDTRREFDDPKSSPFLAIGAAGAAPPLQVGRRSPPCLQVELEALGPGLGASADAWR